MNESLRNAAKHLYVHVPFCQGKCDYCGFYSVVADEEIRAEFAPLPGRELQILMEATDVPPGELAPQTIYFGGGTPAMLGEKGLRTLVADLRLRADLSQVKEWTVELNPATTTRELAKTLRELGVNRVSIGAQSFDDEVLRRIGRRHDVAAIGQAVAAVRGAGFENVGLDLIAGLPGVTPEIWRTTVEQALALAPEHLSIYALTLECGTPMAKRVEEGVDKIDDPEQQLAALAEAEDALAKAGLARYEISNYARPGRECLHNLAVWRGEDYLGLGPHASARVGVRRWTNHADVRGYMSMVFEGARPSCEAEDLEPMGDVTERLLFGLRLAEGVALENFVARFPVAAERLAEWNATLARLAEQGVVERVAATGGAWRLTSRGREVADAVIMELI